MRLMRVPLHLSLLMALMLCLAPCLHGQEASDTREMARQLASEANDNAISLEERQEALRKLAESARLFLSVSETIEAARVLNRAGRLQLISHQPQDAIASHSQALDLLKQTPVTEVEVDSLNGLGAVYVLQDEKKEEAEKVLRRAHLLSVQSDYTAGRALALLTLSEVQNTYNHALALQTAQEAFALWQALDDQRGLASTYAQIGQYYMAQNMLPESTQNYEQSLNLWCELNNPSGQAEALIHLGYIEHRKGEWSNAISFYMQAQSIVDERAEPERMGQIAAGLASAFNETGSPENGLTHFKRALKYYRLAQNPGYVTYAISRLGLTHYLLGNYPEAITYLQQARALLHNDSLQADCDEFLGRAYLSIAKYELALQHLQSALAIYRQAVNPKEAARVQALLGQVAEQQGQPERARQYYQLALKRFTKLSDRVNQAAVYFGLGRLELTNRNYDVAEDYLSRSIEVTEGMRRVSTSRDLTTAFSATVHERYEKYIECLMRKHQMEPARGLDVRAFEISERARARSLAELLRVTETNLVPGLNPQLAELAAQEKSLRQSLRVNDDSKVALLGRAYKSEELAALEAETAQLEEKYKHVLEAIRARYPAYEQITRPAAWDLRQIQEQVIADDQTVLLEYSLGTDKSYVWAVTQSSITSYELPAQAQVNAAAEKVYNLLATPPGADSADELTPAVEELGRMVLSPVAAQLNKRRIIVIADGALNYIPFQVLPAPSAHAEPLVASVDVINAPSATVLGELRQEVARRAPAARVLAAFGDPVFASDYAQRKDSTGRAQLSVMQALGIGRLQRALRDVEIKGEAFDPSTAEPLHYAGQELANLNEVAGEETFMATDFEATREQLLRADLTKYAILHFATHGFFYPEHPEKSGLVLSTVNREGKAQNGFVGLQDVYELRAPVALVVLSACGTALGKDVRGEGLVGLTRGFMYAGAASVVASLWKVDDDATSELMKRFYTDMLQRGMTPASALRAAQNSIRQQPGWQSPYYWAAFTLQGDYRQVIKPGPATASTAIVSWKIIVSGSLLMLLAGSGWWYRRHLSVRIASKRAGAYSTVKK